LDYAPGSFSVGWTIAQPRFIACKGETPPRIDEFVRKGSNPWINGANEFPEILAALEAERDRLNNAISALQGGQRRRPAGKATNGRKRHLSAAARRRIGEAMKKRWAERKKTSAA